MRIEQDTGGKAGILGVMLRSAAFKDILRTNLNEMSTSSGSSFVKTLMREDPEVFFALISSLPVIVNAMAKASAEFALQLRDKYPPEMLQSFLMSLLEDIDKDAFRQCFLAWKSLTVTLWETSADIREKAGRAIMKRGPALVSECMNRCARAVNEVDPLTFGTFLSRVLGGVDREEIDKASKTLAGALLDQEWHLVSWIWSFAKARVMKKLGRSSHQVS